MKNCAIIFFLVFFNIIFFNTCLTAQVENTSSSAQEIKEAGSAMEQNSSKTGQVNSGSDKYIKYLKSKIQLSGSYEFGLEYVDIDKAINNTSYNRLTTSLFKLLSTGRTGDYNFTGIISLKINDHKPQRKLEFETLRLEFSKPEINYLFGHFYPQYSELTINNQKMQGLKIDITKKKYSVNIFSGISNDYDRITIYNQTPKYLQYLYGLRYNFMVTPENTLSFTIFEARDDRNSIDTGTPTLGPIRNTIMHLGYYIPLKNDKGKITLETGKSLFDKDINNDTNRYRNESLLTNVQYNFLPNLRTVFQYKYYGKKYYTAGNPSLNSSEIGYDGMLFQYEYSLTSYLFKGYSEIYKEYSYDTSGNNTKYFIYDNSLKYSINANEEITLSTYFKDSANYYGTNDKFKSTYKVIYSLKKKNARITTNLNYSETNDRSITNSDSKIKGFTLNYSDKYLKGKINFSSLLMGNITSLVTGDIKFLMSNASIYSRLIPGKLNLSANLGYQLSSTSTELTRIYTNKCNLKYYLSYEKSLELETKNDRKFGGVSTYNVWDTFLKYAIVF